MQARQSLLTPTVHPRLNTETATIDVAMSRGPVTHGKDNQAGDPRGRRSRWQQRRAQRVAHWGSDGSSRAAASAAWRTHLRSRNFGARARKSGERSEPRSLRSAERGAPEPGSRADARHPSRSKHRAALCAAWLPLLPRRARAGAAGRRGGRRGGGGGGGDGGGEAGARERAPGERRPSRATGACGPGAERGARCCWRYCSAGTRG